MSFSARWGEGGVVARGASFLPLLTRMQPACARRTPWARTRAGGGQQRAAVRVPSRLGARRGGWVHLWCGARMRSLFHMPRRVGSTGPPGARAPTHLGARALAAQLLPPRLHTPHVEAAVRVGGGQVHALGVVGYGTRVGLGAPGGACVCVCWVHREAARADHLPAAHPIHPPVRAPGRARSGTPGPRRRRSA